MSACGSACDRGRWWVGWWDWVDDLVQSPSPQTHSPTLKKKKKLVWKEQLGRPEDLGVQDARGGGCSQRMDGF